jgi:hypothetical protein
MESLDEQVPQIRNSALAYPHRRRSSLGEKVPMAAHPRNPRQIRTTRLISITPQSQDLMHHGPLKGDPRSGCALAHNVCGGKCPEQPSRWTMQRT